MSTTTQDTAIVFENPGNIDPLAWSVMGLSAKETENPFGYFGTGLKYALAVLLRTGHEVTIYTEGKCYEFSSAKRDFRGTEFQHVLCNGKELPFTLSLGRNWEVWQAFRELYCNAMDEDGTCREMKLESIQPFETCIVVKGEEIRKAYEKRSLYFLDPMTVLAESHDRSTLHTGSGVFYRGVRVSPNDVTSLYAYNLVSEQKLTEDRTLHVTYSVQSAIGGLISFCKNEDIISNVLCCQDDTKLEANIQPFVLLASGFARDIALAIAKNRPTALRQDVLTELTQRNPELQFEPFKPSNTLVQAVQAACDRLVANGFPVSPTVEYVDNKDNRNVAFTYQNKIHLTRKCEGLTSDELTGMLLEEHLHAKECLSDFSREMQNRLIEEIVKRFK